MKRFFYKAKNNAGALTTGEVEAPTEAQAAKLIREKGLFVISIKPLRDNPLNFITKFKDRITNADVANFTRQLATMVSAGLPISQGLLILRAQEKGSMQKIVAQILTDVEGGEALSKALIKHPKVFSQTYVALVRAGEAGGVMDEVLVRLADNLEKEQEFKGKVKGALIYPAIIVVGMGIVGIILMIFVIPRLTALYSEFGAELPLPTRILIGASSLVFRFWNRD